MLPLLKYAGGKRALAPVLVPRLQAALTRTGGRYVEPFFGSGAIFFALDPNRAIVSDVLKPIVELYEAIRENPETFCQWATQLAGTPDEESYYRIRTWEPMALVERAARTYYLNKAGYNGLYRTNRAGKFNVPWGKHKSVTVPSLEELVAYRNMLVKAEIACCDFRTTILKIKPGDVGYFDPPYDDTFVGYSGQGFDKTAQSALAGQLRHFVEKEGCTIFASNNDTPFVRELYAWAKIEDATERRAINRNGAGRAPVKTVLISAGG